MRWNRSEQKQEARTAGSVQHEQPTFASLPLLVTCNAIRRPNYEAWNGKSPNTLRRLDVECSSSHSQRSVGCHLGEMALTRQRLVTFLRKGDVPIGRLQVKRMM